jgi:hypothetical protein
MTGSQEVVGSNPITIISCEGDDGNTNNNSNNLTINPPSWIHGVYLLADPDGQVGVVGFEFKSDDMCTVTANLSGCYQAQLDLYANTPNFETDVYEESDSNRYFIELTIGSTIYKYEFEKLSSTSIKQIFPTYELTLLLQ